MPVKIYTPDDQKLFRRILDLKGEPKSNAMRLLIEQKLDEEAAIIAWLKRNNNYDLYLQLNKEYNQ